MKLFTTLRRLIAGALCPELVEQRDRFERLANTDPLTSVANRRALDLALPTAEADPHTRVVAFDVNHFKDVNDTHGHLAGDALLRDVARAIQRVASARGYGARVFRYGGDEFVVLAPEVAAYRIRDAAEADFGTVGLRPGVRVSLSGTVGRTFAEADAALQARKAVRKGSPAAEELLREVQA